MRKILLAVSVIAVIALSVLELTYRDTVKPDVVYDMANQRIEWYYAGK